MYRNIVWFVAGYITCKTVLPFVADVTIRVVDNFVDKEELAEATFQGINKFVNQES